MNLRGIANAATQAINPNIIGTWKVSTGYTTGADGSRTPTYSTVNNVPMQVQALTGGDLKQLERLNIQQVNDAVYMNGNVEGVNRPAVKGGDILVYGGVTHVIVAVLENWMTSGWTKVATVDQL